MAIKTLKVGAVHPGMRLELGPGHKPVKIVESHLDKMNNRARLVTREADGTFKTRPYNSIHAKVKIRK